MIRTRLRHVASSGDATTFPPAAAELAEDADRRAAGRTLNWQ